MTTPIPIAARNTTHWLPLNGDASEIDCLCLGTGRFLRSVLYPALVAANLKPALIQPRGRSFVDHMLHANKSNGQQEECCYSYEIDTVLESGHVQTETVPCYGAFSLGNSDGKQALVQLLPKMQR
jgi:hypothetical protein